jgi:hypothetical protein
LAPQFDYSSSVADETHTPAKSALLVKIVLTVTKRNPGQFTLGEVGGWGPPGLTY